MIFPLLWIRDKKMSRNNLKLVGHKSGVRYERGTEAMLKGLQVRNFRGFKALKIEQLSGINLIAGKNNSGKTSLLEAIFLLCGAGNVQLAINTNVIRAVEPGAPLNDPYWKQLFYDLDMRSHIEIKAYDKSRVQSTLKITSERQPITEASLKRTNGISAANLFDEGYLAFQFTGPSSQTVKCHIRRKEQGFEIKPPSSNPLFRAIILLSRNRNTREDAMRLGQLRRRKQGSLLLKALQVIEPRLQSIEDNTSSGTPMIWGDIGLSELVPLEAMGEGMTQIARIVLGIASAADGVVLVDEVENGIYHSVLPDFWRAIDEAAKQFHTQVFATTHSFECVIAAHESLSKDRFRLHRLEIAEEMSRCVTYEPDAIDAAIRHGLEVR